MRGILLEVGWIFPKVKNTVYISSGTATGRKRVTVIINNRIVNDIREYLPINDQLIKITLDEKPVKLHMLQVQMPTSESPDNEVKEPNF